MGSRLPRRKQAQRRAQLPIIAGQRSGEQLEPPSGDAARRMPDHGRAALLLYGVALVDMAASSLTFALTPGRVIELGGDAKTIGLLSGFVGALQLVAGPLVGRYSDRLADRRWVLILGLLASALGSAVASLAADPMTFFLSRVPAGLFAHTLNQLRAVRPTAKLCFPPSRCRHRAPAAASAALQPAARLRARLTARSASLGADLGSCRRAPTSMKALLAARAGTPSTLPISILPWVLVWPLARASVVSCRTPRLPAWRV